MIIKSNPITVTHLVAVASFFTATIALITYLESRANKKLGTDILELDRELKILQLQHEKKNNHI